MKRHLYQRVFSASFNGYKYGNIVSYSSFDSHIAQGVLIHEWFILHHNTQTVPF